MQHTIIDPSTCPFLRMLNKQLCWALSSFLLLSFIHCSSRGDTALPSSLGSPAVTAGPGCRSRLVV